MANKPKEELWTGDRGTDQAARFGRCRDEDELLHPQASIPGDTLTETWAYLWYVPEERIYSQIHVWVHPNLGVVTAGIGVWRGHKNSMISAEIMDVRAYCSAAALGDGRDMRFVNGLHVEILEPFKKIKITYEDSARGNALDLLITDFSPPVMRGSENHFDQAVRNKGRVTLRGRSHEIDSYGMRDRSWGQLRTEALVPAPPFSWMTGTFSGLQMSWHLAAYDDPARKPDWLGLFDVKPEETIHDGWLFRDGQLSRLKRASKITHRDRKTLRPVSHEVHFADQAGREYHIAGRITASLPWVAWPNMSAYLCLTEWRFDGEIGWGDTQEVQWGDFVHALRQDQEPPPATGV
jgi:hypothetical protein